MSGAFETAASAFAVVGVVDVVVRTGREIYSFLSDVADAPNSMQKLRDCVDETNILAQACKHCSARLNTRAQSLLGSTTTTITPLSSALKALERELRALKLKIAKFTGTNKTWSRVKFVLDERKIEKTLGSLERSKTLLANALLVAYGELSTTEHQSIESLIQQCAQQVGLSVDGVVQVLTTALESNHQTLTTKLDKHHTQVLASQEALRQGLASKLDAQYQQASANIDANHHVIATKLDIYSQQHLKHDGAQQQKLSSLLQTQQQTLMGQDRIRRTCTRTLKQSTQLSKQLNRASGASTRNHKITQDNVRDLTARIDQLEISLTKQCATMIQGGREIHFIGERRDMIMAYLLSIKDQLKQAIDQTLVEPGEGVSARHACWLETQFKHLLGSAAQNEAARYSDSTATAFDQWSFSEDTIRLRRPNTNQKATGITDSTETDDSANQTNMAPQRRKRTKLSHQTFDTPTGTLRISFPRNDTSHRDLQDSDEISISFTSRTSQPFCVLNAYFCQKILNASRPAIYAQLNVFTFAPDLDSHPRAFYLELFQDGTIEDVNTALRKGTISPYYLAMENGLNFLLFAAVSCGRNDLLDYFDSQGIGISNLRQDDSVLWGTMGTDTKKFEAICDQVLDNIEDPLHFS